MRVLHIGKYFPPEPGGIERFLDELTRAQANAGLAVSVIAHDRHRSGSERLAERTIHRCRSLGQVLFTPIAPDWPRRLSQVIATERPDLLHLHLPNPSAFAALALPAARRLKWVLHWHADVPLDAAHAGLRLAYPAYALFERALLTRSQAVIATSQAYLDASQPLRRFRDRCHVVPLGLGEAPLPGRPPTWPSPGLRVLAVGRLSYYKGFDRLIEAVSRVPGTSLMLIGSGEQRASLEQLIRRLGVDDRVRRASGLEDAEVEAAYRTCDVVCLPSIDRAEAFGLVLLEALRAGRPLIASRLAGSGMTEVVEHEVTGLQVEPGSIDALVSALTRLRDDPGLLAQLASRARDQFDARFTLPPVVSAISSIYRTVVRSAGTGGPKAGTA